MVRPPKPIPSIPASSIPLALSVIRIESESGCCFFEGHKIKKKNDISGKNKRGDGRGGGQIKQEKNERKTKNKYNKRKKKKLKTNKQKRRKNTKTK